jgi:hypothetical protein
LEEAGIDNSVSQSLISSTLKLGKLDTGFIECTVDNYSGRFDIGSFSIGRISRKTEDAVVIIVTFGKVLKTRSGSKSEEKR